MSGYTVKPPTGDTNEQTQFIDYFNLFYSKRGQEQISISQQLGNYGTTFFSASRQSYWNTSRSDQQISFGLNVPFGDITTSLNYSYSNNIWQNDRDQTPTEVIHRLAPVVTVLLIIVELTVIRMSVTVGMVTAARFITE